MTEITSVTFRDDTILRLGGDGAWAGMTWAADDRQFGPVCDGSGLSLLPTDHFFSTRVFAVGGARPAEATCQELPGYPDIPMADIYNPSAPPLYYGFTVLAVDGCLYQYLSTSTMFPFFEDFTVRPGFHLNAVKLIYSPDQGRTWCNQDGSSPVARELRDELTPERTVFLQEPDDAFSLLSFLQMGRDYGDNRDGYVYVYGLNGVGEGRMNELVMFRVPKDRLLDRGSFEYFHALRPDGAADWVQDIGRRGVVQSFPRGWLPPNFAVSWLPSVVYNMQLGLYMMVSSSSTNPEGIGHEDKPSYLGIWVSQHPWGPWRQIHEEAAWTPAGDPGARAGAPVIAPKWIAEDGKSFWLVWHDAQLKTDAAHASEAELIDAMRSTTAVDAFRGRLLWRQTHPYYGLNVQRVDLALG